MRLVSVRSRVRTSLEAIRVGVVGNISACHADAPGSIPGHGDHFFFPLTIRFIFYVGVSYSVSFILMTK